ncbi:tetratricopeptide repeat protein [Amycolatopsis sp. NPDC051716]|uniref:tetratricopeptide repeat protein n=1 Tax=Amycolatopsis sp. NPDC051716 TaxID=3155804 RepID=UPI00341BA4AE
MLTFARPVTFTLLLPGRPFIRSEAPFGDFGMPPRRARPYTRIQGECVWGEMEHSRLVVHRTVLAVDIEGYGNQGRTTPHRLVVRQGLDLALRRAFKEAGVPWFDCRHESTGDGTLVLVPAQVLKGPFVEVLSVALARELEQHNETHRAEERIRLRMALHAGEVAYDDQGATGPAINQTFRLIEAPQLKIALAESPGTLALITSTWFFDEVVRSSTIVDSSTFRPVRVAVKETATVGWISLPDHPYPPNTGELVPAEPEQPPRRPEAAPCPPAVSGRSTLPRDLPAFTGRAQELAELTATVSTAAGQGTLGMAVHVVDGMPGIGKTTFAVRAAYRLAGYFPDGQVFLELHGHSPGQAPVDPGDALASLLMLRGVPAIDIPAGLDDRARLWREKLAGRKILLLLDDAVGDEQVRPLLPGSPGSLVLVTSRRRLESVADAGPVSLQTLPPPDAAAMFQRYTGAHRHDPRAVAELMAMCGYLPLAITLTAGRLRNHPCWTPEQLADDLRRSRNRITMFRAGSRTVAAAFDLSYRDLSPDEKRLFRRLALHPGTRIEVHAAAALDGEDPEATCERLDALYLNHLLEEVAPGRYRLHDLTRAYSLTLSSEDGDDKAFERLLDHYLYAVRSATRFVATRGPRPQIAAEPPVGTHEFESKGEAIAWLSAERANLGACITYAAVHGHLHRAAELAGALHPYLEQHGYWHDAHRIDQTVLAAELAAGNLTDEAATRADLGRVQSLLGDYPAAVEHLIRAQDLCAGSGDRLGEAAALTEIGFARMELSEYPEAIEYLTRARTLYEKLENPFGVAGALGRLASVQFRLGRHDAARADGRRALALYTELGNRLGEALSLLCIGCTYGVCGDYASAIDTFGQVLSLSRELGDRYTEARALNNLGRMYFECGDYGMADSCYSSAQLIYSRLDSRTREAVALNNLGRLHHAGGNFRLSLRYLERARVLFGDDRAWQAENLNNLGGLALAWPEAGDPGEFYRQALGRSRAIGLRLQEGRALEGLGRCSLRAVDVADGVARLREALVVFDELKAPEAKAVRAALAHFVGG